MLKKYQLAFEIPYGACDCHHHVYNPKDFPATPFPALPWEGKPEHPVAEYRRLMYQAGFTRNILLATSAYGYNRSCDMDAMAKFGTDTTRYVGLLQKSVTDEKLIELHSKGWRGVRAYFQTEDTVEDFLSLAPRIAKLGWHLDFTFNGRQDLDRFLELLPQIPCDIVIAHHAGIQDVNDPYLPTILKLLQEKRIWVKLSAIFRPVDLLADMSGGNTIHADEIARNIAIGEKMIEAAPDRLLWATDWPFNWSNFNDMETLIKVIPNQIKDPAVRHMILVENPAKLYGFDDTM